MPPRRPFLGGVASVCVLDQPTCLVSFAARVVSLTSGYAEPWLESLADLKPKTRHQYQWLIRQYIMPTWRTFTAVVDLYLGFLSA